MQYPCHCSNRVENVLASLGGQLRPNVLPTTENAAHCRLGSWTDSMMVVVSTAFTPEGVGWSRLARVWGGVAPQFSFGSSRAPPLFDRAAWSMTYLLIYEHKYIHTQQIDFKILQYPRHREEPLILSTRVDYKPGEIKYPGTSWPHYNLCPHILRSV